MKSSPSFFFSKLSEDRAFLAAYIVMHAGVSRRFIVQLARLERLRSRQDGRASVDAAARE